MQSMDLFQGYTLSFWRIWHTTSFSADRNIFHFLFFWVSNIYVALTLLISRRITRTSSVLLIIVAVDISTLVKSQSFSKMNKYERSNITKENLELTSVSPTRSPSSPSAPWAPDNNNNRLIIMLLLWINLNNDSNLVGVLQEEDPESQLVLPHPPRVSRFLGRQIVLPGSLLLDNVHSRCIHSPPSLPIFIVSGSGSGSWGREAVNRHGPGHRQGRHGDQTLTVLTNERTAPWSRDLYWPMGGSPRWCGQCGRGVTSPGLCWPLCCTAAPRWSWTPGTRRRSRRSEPAPPPPWSLADKWSDDCCDHLNKLFTPDVTRHCLPVSTGTACTAPRWGCRRCRRCFPRRSAWWWCCRCSRSRPPASRSLPPPPGPEQQLYAQNFYRREIGISVSFKKL